MLSVMAPTQHIITLQNFTQHYDIKLNGTQHFDSKHMQVL
jgi:hypothetical protein